MCPWIWHPGSDIDSVALPFFSLAWAVKLGWKTRKDKSLLKRINSVLQKKNTSVSWIIWNNGVEWKKLAFGEKAESHQTWMCSGGGHLKCTFIKSLSYLLTTFSWAEECEAAPQVRPCREQELFNCAEQSVTHYSHLIFCTFVLEVDMSRFSICVLLHSCVLVDSEIRHQGYRRSTVPIWSGHLAKYAPIPRMWTFPARFIEDTSIQTSVDSVVHMQQCISSSLPCVLAEFVLSTEFAKFRLHKFTNPNLRTISENSLITVKTAGGCQLHKLQLFPCS